MALLFRPFSRLALVLPLAWLPLSAPAQTLRPAASGPSAPGLEYSYYEGLWSALPNFSLLTPKATGTTVNISLAPRLRPDNFSIEFRGLVKVPAEGLYQFFLASDDGSRLYLDDTLLINNDGLHAKREYNGKIGLKAGFHRLRLGYFERTGQEVLTLSYAGPGFAKKAVPDSALARPLPVPLNQPPQVSAGPDTAITLPSSLTLRPVFSDDGYPAGSVLSRGWQKVSGPDSVSFSGPDTAKVFAFSDTGLFALRFFVSDGEYLIADTVRIRVHPAPLSQILYQGRILGLSGRPLPGATIHAAGSSAFALSDSAGFFSLRGSAVLLSSRTLLAFAAGFDTVSLGVPDTALGIVLSLPRPYEPDHQPVRSQVLDQTRGIKVCSTTFTTETYRWAGSQLPGYNKCRGGWNATRTETRPGTLIRLDNGLVRLDISPTFGMRVLRAQDLRSGDSLALFWENPFSYGQWWSLSGGVEPSYPFFEAGTSADSQKAGHRVIENADGSVTVAMNMLFSHRQDLKDIGFLGHYGDRPLSCFITLRPGQNLFEITYRSENPNPTRRSDRMWTNTYFPKSGAEALFPAYWAMDHGLKAFWPSRGALDTTKGVSHFGLYPELPFAGGWYANAGINRLRISDPVKSPGLKVYFDKNQPNYFEVWGGTQVLFEAPKGFVDEYQPLEVTHRYYLTRQIGKAHFANADIALSLPDSAHFEIVTTRQGRLDLKNLDGTPIAAGIDADPDHPVTGAFLEGLIVHLNGEKVFEGRLPIALSADSSRLDEVRQSTIKSWGWNLKPDAPAQFKYGNADLRTAKGFDFALNMEMEGIQSRAETLNKLGAAYLDPALAAGVPADRLLSVARTHYGLGRFDRAEAFLQKAESAVPTADQTADIAYLRALIAWEKGLPADFAAAGKRANYHRALLAVQQGDKDGALSFLREYLAAFPSAFRPRLLLAYLSSDLSLAARLAQENPGSPEVLAVLQELGHVPAASALSTLVETSTGADIALTDFLKELKEGKWRHGRRYETVPSFLSSYPFPSFLKY